jgi:hypothetical protein
VTCTRPQANGGGHRIHILLSVNAHARPLNCIDTSTPSNCFKLFWVHIFYASSSDFSLNFDLNFMISGILRCKKNHFRGSFTLFFFLFLIWAQCQISGTLNGPGSMQLRGWHAHQQNVTESKPVTQEQLLEEIGLVYYEREVSGLQKTPQFLQTMPTACVMIKFHPKCSLLFPIPPDLRYLRCLYKTSLANKNISKYLLIFPQTCL